MDQKEVLETLQRNNKKLEERLNSLVKETDRYAEKVEQYAARTTVWEASAKALYLYFKHGVEVKGLREYINFIEMNIMGDLEDEANSSKE